MNELAFVMISAKHSQTIEIFANGEVIFTGMGKPTDLVIINRIPQLIASAALHASEKQK